MNVALVSKIENAQVDIVSALSYLGYGENTTYARIKTTSSSMQSENIEKATNQKLDEILNASWGNVPNSLQFIEVVLESEDELSQLTIWAKENFPKDYSVYVVPQDVKSPNKNNLNSWCIENIKNKNIVSIVTEGAYQGTVKEDSWSSPYRISLGDKKGDRIVIAWANSNLHKIEVREFEVIKVPRNPGAIGFAGQWLDRETNMYYQINRYRLVGSEKFISPDPIGFMDGNNLYAYAKNNPLEWHDPDGRFAHILWGAGIGAIFGGGSYALNCWLTGAEFKWSEFGVQTAIGATTGAVAAATFGGASTFLASANLGVKTSFFISSTASGFSGGFASGSLGTLSQGGSFQEALTSGGKSGIWGALGGAVTSGVLSQTCLLSRYGEITKYYNRRNPKNYARSSPSGSMRAKTWEDNREASTGQVRDPLTGRFMSKDKDWDMGHRPGHEFRKHRNSAKERGIDGEQFKEEQNNTDNYRPELPSSNRSHKGEDKTSNYFGP